MRLSKVPQRQGVKVRIISEDKAPPAHREFNEQEILTFSHIDGMYSYCTDFLGNVVHLVAWAEVEIVK